MENKQESFPPQCGSSAEGIYWDLDATNSTCPWPHPSRMLPESECHFISFLKRNSHLRKMLDRLAGLQSQQDQNSCLLPFQCWSFWFLLIVGRGFLWFSLQVQQLQGVYNLQEPHFWTLCTDVYIGTLKLLVAPDADSRWILSQTHNIFTQVRESVM